jgi:release factor glutamine methyltransferase
MLESSITQIQSLLSWANEQLRPSSDTATLDTEVLLCHCLNKNRSFLRAWPEHSPNQLQIQQFQTLIQERQRGLPIAYLTGQKEFWSRNFTVSPDVLIPRPDSELLIELSLSLLPKNQPCKIIDLGTGSGILALTLAAERPKFDVLATDISHAALRIAQLNAKQLQIDNVRWLQSSWFEQVTEIDFDLIISNPPYIEANDPHLQQGDVRFEPKTALISAENGLEDIRILADKSRAHLKHQGHLLVEHGYNQQNAVQAIFKKFNYSEITTHPDLSGNPRVTSGVWNPL